jgi:photosynthetic reaction center M subunit
MADFQTIYTQIQARGPDHFGPSGQWGDIDRVGKPIFIKWLGRIGDAQIGPVYLGASGVGGIAFGLTAILIIGFNMLAQVSFDPLQFFRQFFWLGLYPPKAQYGMGIPPLNDGGWWLMAGLMMTLSLGCWWIRVYSRARALGLGTHIAWNFAMAIFFVLCIGFFHPVLVGSWSEAVPFGIFPHLDWLTAFSMRYGNFYYCPWHGFSIGFAYGCGLLFAAHGATILAVARFGGDREIEQITDRGTAVERAALFWRWTMGFNATIESIHRWGWFFSFMVMFSASVGILLTGTFVDNWYLWCVKHGAAPDYPAFLPATPDPAAGTFDPRTITGLPK